jgi:hypothetical protein
MKLAKIARAVADRYITADTIKRASPNGVSFKSSKWENFEGELTLKLGNLEPLIPVLEEMGHPDGEDTKLTDKDFAQNFSNLWSEKKLSKKLEPLLEKHLGYSINIEISDLLVELYDVDLRDFKNCLVYLKFYFSYLPLELYSDKNYKILTTEMIQELQNSFRKLS